MAHVAFEVLDGPGRGFDGENLREPPTDVVESSGPGGGSGHGLSLIEQGGGDGAVMSGAAASVGGGRRRSADTRGVVWGFNERDDVSR